jgi:ABC-type nickel/cobalt efflux system permease component RcnA
MEHLSLLLIFWYGILHAFGPDHLTAIADFSIGKDKRKTILITVLFAIGHGLGLFVFAKILQSYHIGEEILGYGNIISSSVILGMGVYLLYMVATDRIQLKKHIHNDKEHIHIWFGKEHKHNNKDSTSAFTLGALMGIGGVRGMLITLGVIEGQSVDFSLVLAFTLGVMIVFLGFGVIILFINKNLLNSKQNLKRVFASIGTVSVLVGGNMLFAKEPSFLLHSHAHINYNITKADKLVQSKTKSDMTYKQMMQRMGEAYKMMQSGIINQNKELVKIGAWMIQNHPAPKEKPWSIVKEEDVESFKETLLSYDSLLHQSAQEIGEALKYNDWVEINEKVFEMSNHCISCHSAWKNNLKGKIP